MEIKKEDSQPKNEDAAILLVEDDDVEAALTLEALRRYGAAERVVRARDGKAALDFIFSGSGSTMRSPAPCLILLDLKPPKLDGLEFLRRLKSDAAANIIPVVVLSSSKLDNDILSSYRLGANSYIVKPINFGEFADAVGRLAAYWLELNRGASATVS